MCLCLPWFVVPLTFPGHICEDAGMCICPWWPSQEYCAKILFGRFCSECGSSRVITNLQKFLLMSKKLISLCLDLIHLYNCSKKCSFVYLCPFGIGSENLKPYGVKKLQNPENSLLSEDFLITVGCFSSLCYSRCIVYWSYLIL